MMICAGFNILSVFALLNGQEKPITVRVVTKSPLITVGTNNAHRKKLGRVA